MYRMNRPRNVCFVTLVTAVALAPQVARAVGDAVEFAVPFELSDPVRIAAGKKRFGVNCAAYCHGSEGEGVKTPSFKGKKDFSPAAAHKVITEGRRAADIMPPWGNSFTSEEIWELVAYLNFLSKQPPSE